MDSRIQYKTISDFLPKWCFTRNILIVSMILLFTDIILIFEYKTDTLFTFILTYVIVVAINAFTIKAPRHFLTFIYVLVVGMALLMVLSNSVNIPRFLGMTDALNGGTDDAFYFIQAMLGAESEAVDMLPTIRYDAYLPERMTVYSWMLHYWGQVLNQVVTIYPLDLLFLNIIFICFYNLECIRFCFKLTGDNRCVSTIIPLLLFCPFVFSNGLILMRDVIVAWCFVAACNCVLSWKLRPLLFPVICMIALRPAAIAEFAIMAWFMLLASDHLKLEGKKKRHITFWILGVAVSFLVAVNNISTIMRYASQISGGMRISTMSLVTDDNTLRHLYNFPVLLRIPLMAFYFFISPTFNIDAFFNGNVFEIRDGVFHLFGLMNLVLLPRFINGFVYSMRFDKNRQMKYVSILFIILMIFISQLSTIIRHKTGFIFLYYVVASYGKYHRTKTSVLIGYACSAVLTIYYIVNTFIL